MKKTIATICGSIMILAASSNVFASGSIPADVDRSQYSQKIDFGIDSSVQTRSFTTMATGESLLNRAFSNFVPGSTITIWEYSATGVTDPKSITYVASVTTSLFHEGAYLGQSDQALGLAGFDAEAYFLAESTVGGYWEAFSNHTITNGSDFFTAYTVDGNNY
ncbi:hypothetical protein [Paenibacillus montanisoli]|uniref:Uncharacterized protein n=1 Tax=Paenibacillus montanisoli TaxID=2081970 RepID=A0A328TXX0_9BACL|nr:hypothetical protein [Paenibacillus montanisoli]RAP73535.1 hypothetical protein DL346_24965 [Paenibacillus montanisoli]